MSTFELVTFNLLSPAVLAFVLGIVATLVKSDLKFPEALYSSLTIYLLISLGMKGGSELSQADFSTLWLPSLGTLFVGSVTPVLTYAVVKSIGKFSVSDSAAIAAHYGSVSVVTFIATLTFLDAMGISYEQYVTALVVVLEVPGIVIALMIAQVRNSNTSSMKEVLHEVITGRSILLLLGGLGIGFLAGKPGMERVEAFFIAPFQGAVVLFLLEMGMVASRRLKDLKKVGVFLLIFAMVMPVINGTIGIVIGYFTGMSLGGMTVLGVLCASASYIAAPAAVRVALPEANPSYYLTASLGITFPFNLTVGIPLLYNIARLFPV